MSRPARSKRCVRRMPRIGLDDVTWFVYGFSFFDEEENVPEKWEFCKDDFMEQWLTFQPFEFAGHTVDQNVHGTRPFMWWLDKGLNEMEAAEKIF